MWRCRPLHLRELIADERRVARLQIEDDGILLDYSRQRLTTKTVQLLLALAQATGLQAKIRAMAAGEEINYTEGRPVLHMALRAPRGDKLEVGGVDVIAQVHAPILPLTLTLTLTLTLPLTLTRCTRCGTRSTPSPSACAAASTAAPRARCSRTSWSLASGARR